MKFLDLAEVEGLFIVVVGVHHHAAALARGGEFGALGSFLGARVLLIAALLSISNKVNVGSGLKLLVGRACSCSAGRPRQLLGVG